MEIEHGLTIMAMNQLRRNRGSTNQCSDLVPVDTKSSGHANRSRSSASSTGTLSVSFPILFPSRRARKLFTSEVDTEGSLLICLS